MGSIAEKYPGALVSNEVPGLEEIADVVNLDELDSQQLAALRLVACGIDTREICRAGAIEPDALIRALRTVAIPLLSRLYPA